AVRLDPGWGEAHRSLGLLLAQVGRADEARRELEEAVRLEPGDGQAELALAAMDAERGDWAQSERRYRAALGAARGREQATAARRGLGDALVKQDRLGEAAAQYAAVLALVPDDASVLGALAWIRATSGRAESRDGAEAVRLAERACALTERRDADA